MGKFFKNITIGLFLYHNYKIVIASILCVISFFGVEIIFSKWSNYDFRIMFDLKFYIFAFYTLLQSILLVGFIQLIRSFKFKKDENKEKIPSQNKLINFFHK